MAQIIYPSNLYIWVILLGDVILASSVTQPTSLCMYVYLVRRCQAYLLVCAVSREGHSDTIVSEI